MREGGRGGTGEGGGRREEGGGRKERGVYLDGNGVALTIYLNFDCIALRSAAEIN